MIEKTFAIIKPHAVKAKNAGAIIDMIEKNGFDILAMKKILLSKNEAEEFYAVHKEKPFFSEVIENITKAPVIVMALQKENGIQAWRDLMGSTNAQEAAEGTIRKLFGKDIEFNAVHGSDAPETAVKEIAFFFPNI